MNAQLETSEAFTFEISCILEASLTLVNFYFLKLWDSFYLSQNYGHISFLKLIIVTPEVDFFFFKKELVYPYLICSFPLLAFSLNREAIYDRV